MKKTICIARLRSRVKYVKPLEHICDSFYECLKQFVKNNESDMLKYKNFGRKSLIELNEILANMSLSFGMDLSLYADALEADKKVTASAKGA